MEDENTLSVSERHIMVEEEDYHVGKDYVSIKKDGASYVIFNKYEDETYSEMIEKATD